MKTTRIFAAAALIAASALAPRAAAAQWPGIERTDLMRNDLSAPGREVIQVLVGFAPGAAAPRHSHPGEELVYVVAGVLEYQLDGRPPVTVRAGEVLFIPSGVVHAVRNVGGGNAVELATYVVEKGKPLLVPAGERHFDAGHDLLLEVHITTQEPAMSVTEVGSSAATMDARVGTVDMKLEVVTIPVSDVDRAEEFYRRLGWRQDVTPPGSGVFQFTPPGSACSIHFGTNRTSAAPGSAQGLFLIVSDIQAAHDELVRRGIVQVPEGRRVFGGPVGGPDPERGSYRSLATFSDPDGNRWLLQEITTRLPGRIDSAVTTFGSASDLASALRRAAAAHGEHETRIGKADPEGWPDWYAAYLAAEQSGTELPS